MKLQKLFACLLLSYSVMGASKCSKPIPPVPTTPPELEGAWQWSCVELSTSDVIEQNAQPLALSCAQQVPLKSPFMSYVKEHIEFKKDTSAWSAFFSFGTCVDLQEGTYKYGYVETSKENELEIYDSQGVLQQKYNVEKVSEIEIKFSNDLKSCNLTKSTEPIVSKGSHPRPISTIDWDFDIDGGASFWTSSAQFPFVYQSPQLQSRGNPFGTYRTDYVVLNTAIDGSQLTHYAAYIALYVNATNTPLAFSDVKDLEPGASFQIKYKDPNTNSDITVKAVFR